MPLTRTSSTTTGRSGMTKPNSLMYLYAHRPREDSQGKVAGLAGPPPALPGHRVRVPLHKGCPKVSGPGRAGSGRVPVGRHHQRTVGALVAQMQEALSADLGPAAVGQEGHSHGAPERTPVLPPQARRSPALLDHCPLQGPQHRLGNQAVNPTGGGWAAASPLRGQAHPAP